MKFNVFTLFLLIFVTAAGALQASGEATYLSSGEITVQCGDSCPQEASDEGNLHVYTVYVEACGREFDYTPDTGDSFPLSIEFEVPYETGFVTDGSYVPCSYGEHNLDVRMDGAGEYSGSGTLQIDAKGEVDMESPHKAKYLYYGLRKDVDPNRLTDLFLSTEDPGVSELNGPQVIHEEHTLTGQKDHGVKQAKEGTIISDSDSISDITKGQCYRVSGGRNSQWCAIGQESFSDPSENYLTSSEMHSKYPISPIHWRGFYDLQGELVVGSEFGTEEGNYFFICREGQDSNVVSDGDVYECNTETSEWELIGSASCSDPSIGYDNDQNKMAFFDNSGSEFQNQATDENCLYDDVGNFSDRNTHPVNRMDEIPDTFTPYKFYCELNDDYEFEGLSGFDSNRFNESYPDDVDVAEDYDELRQSEAVEYCNNQINDLKENAPNPEDVLLDKWDKRIPVAEYYYTKQSLPTEGTISHLIENTEDDRYLKHFQFHSIYQAQKYQEDETTGHEYPYREWEGTSEERFGDSLAACDTESYTTHHQHCGYAYEPTFNDLEYSYITHPDDEIDIDEVIAESWTVANANAPAKGQIKSNSGITSSLNQGVNVENPQHFPGGFAPKCPSSDDQLQYDENTEMWRCMSSPNYKQEVYLPDIEELGFSNEENLRVGFFLPPYTFEKYSTTTQFEYSGEFISGGSIEQEGEDPWGARTRINDVAEDEDNVNVELDNPYISTPTEGSTDYNAAYVTIKATHPDDGELDRENGEVLHEGTTGDIYNNFIELSWEGDSQLQLPKGETHDYYERIEIETELTLGNGESPISSRDEVTEGETVGYQQTNQIEIEEIESLDTDAVPSSVQNNRTEIFEDPTDDHQPFANAISGDVRIYSMSAFCYLGPEDRFSPEEAGEIPEGQGFHKENIQVPIPAQDEARSQSYQFVTGDTVEGVNAPLPITGTIDGQEAQNFNELTCMWQYQYGDGNGETASKWFTGGNTDNIAPQIGTKITDRNYNINHLDFTPSSTLNQNQITSLRQNYQDDIALEYRDGWGLSTPGASGVSEIDRWQTFASIRDDYSSPGEEGQPQSLLCRMSRWLPIPNTGCL